MGIFDLAANAILRGAEINDPTLGEQAIEIAASYQRGDISEDEAAQGLQPLLNCAE